MPAKRGLSDTVLGLGYSRDFNDRKADVRRVGYVEPIGADASSYLCTAFDQMAGHGCPGQSIEIIFVPAKMIETWRHRQRRIGDATGDHNVRAAGQGIDDRRRAEIRIGRHQSITDAGQRGQYVAYLVKDGQVAKDYRWYHRDRFAFCDRIRDAAMPVKTRRMHGRSPERT